jgi:hypothetical protein
MKLTPYAISCALTLLGMVPRLNLFFAHAVISLMNIPEPWSLSVERTN